MGAMATAGNGFKNMEERKNPYPAAYGNSYSKPLDET